jgi:hypothetical protein
MDKISRLLFGLSMVFGLFLTSGCKDDADPAQAPDACESPAMRLLYTAPGCGADVKPSCVSGGAGACAVPPVCGCDGTMIERRCDGAVADKFQFQLNSAANPSECTKAPGYTPVH